MMKALSSAANTIRCLFSDNNNNLLHWQILILLPAILCILLFGGIYNIVNDQIQIRAEMVVDNFQINCSAVFNEIEVIGNTLKNDSSLKEYLSKDEFNSYDAQYICSIIDSYKSTDSNIRSIFVVSDKTEHIYTESAYFMISSLPAFLSRYGISNDIYENLGSEGVFHLGYSTSSFYYYIPLTDENGDKIASILITLNISVFRNLLKDMNNVSFCGIYDNADPDYYICSHVIPVSSNLNWLNDQEMSDFLGESITLSYKTDETFTYVVAIPRADFYWPLMTVIIFFVVYFITLFAILIGYLFNQQKGRKKAIDALINELPAKPTDQNSSVMDNIKKALEDYRKLLKNTDYSQKNVIVQGILRGYYGNDIPEDIIKESGLDKESPYLFVAGIYVLDLPAMDNYNISDAENLSQDATFVMLRSALETITMEDPLVSFTSATNLYYNCLSVIFFSETASDKFENHVVDTCLKMYQLFSRDYGINLQITLSNMVTDFRNISIASEQTFDLREFAIATANTSSIIRQEQFVSIDNDFSFSNFLQNEQILLNTLIARKYDMIPEIVESIFSYNDQISANQYNNIRSHMNDIKNILIEDIKSNGYQSSLSNIDINALKNAISIPELNAAVCTLYGQIAALASASEKDTVSIACKFIDDNICDENLSVSGIANAVGISIRHLTELFKTRFNMTVADYVNHERITIAKELLKNPKVKISSVATQVGYYSTDTFTRNFRKLEGITPTEYRNIIFSN